MQSLRLFNLDISTCNIVYVCVRASFRSSTRACVCVCVGGGGNRETKIYNHTVRTRGREGERDKIILNTRIKI